MAWGKGGGSLRSCDALLKRVEENDPRLTELVILPMKTFGVSDIERLSVAIASGANTNLQSISASGHHLPPESLKQFGLALSTQAKKYEQSDANEKEENERGITSLAIGCKDMGDVGVIALCEGLQESNGGLLQSVDFGWKNLSKNGLQAIGKTFAASTHLKQLDLSRNNGIGNDGIESFANAAKESNAQHDMVAMSMLEKMILSYCNIGSTGIQSLSEFILGSNERKRSKPIDLTISCNPINSQGCGFISNLCSIPDRGSLVSHLHMSQCSIGDDGLELLSNAATSNAACAGLSVLDISENSITKNGIKTFAESLVKSWPNLVELKIAKNELDDEGVTSLMESLITRSDGASEEQSDEKNSSLQNLDVSCTNCGIEGAKAALTSGGITTLRLFNNKLGSDGFHSMTPLLQGGHPSIENLDLGGNSADEVSVVALLNAIAEMDGSGFISRLCVLEIGGNKFGDDAMDALKKLKLVYPKLDVAHDKPVKEALEE